MITGQGINRRSTAQVLALGDIKEHLRVMDDDHDAELEKLLESAALYVERTVGCSLLQTERFTTYSAFPASIELMYPPTLCVRGLHYVNTNQKRQELQEGTGYRVIRSTHVASVVIPAEGQWPQTDPRPDAVTITYDAGYGTTHHDIPPDAKHLLRMVAAHYDENRSGSVTGTISTEIKLGVRALRAALHTGFYAGAYQA